MKRRLCFAWAFAAQGHAEGPTVFEKLRCARKGHLFVDSRSQPGMQVCVRCHLRKPFEGMTEPRPSKPPET
jgi:hypothetical protein